jgi:hypothetical protein
MRDQCLEGQRFLDYQQGKKGPAQRPAFGAPVAAASGSVATFGLTFPPTTPLVSGQLPTNPSSLQEVYLARNSVSNMYTPFTLSFL